MSRTVIITGASRGIGAQTAREFAAAGYNVAINYMNSQDKALELYNEIISFTGNKYGCIICRADVSDRLQVRDMIKKVSDYLGPADILVNNAGISQYKLFTDISPEEWDRIFSVNVKGIFNCTQEVLPYMIRKRSGKIINVSSIWGICGASMETCYSSSKAAVIGMTKALAKELGPSNIQVNCVAPGVVGTDMNRNLSPEDIELLKQDTPLGVIGSPKNIADVILFLASEKADFMTGQVISPNGGFVI